MLLVLAATKIEMAAYCSSAIKDDHVKTAVCGVGPVESAVRTMEMLTRYNGQIRYVLNFGIGGAYLSESGEPLADLLDIVIAESEVLGDYGICYGTRIESFSEPELTEKTAFEMSSELNSYIGEGLIEQGIRVFRGKFVTVNAASGSTKRGLYLHKKFDATCENMEGAAIARCCDMFSIPMVELRSVSNFVEDRPGEPWKLKEACARSGTSAALVADRIKELL